MASNDLVLLNQLLDQRLSEIGQGLNENDYFEVFSAEQILKDDDLSYDELTAGIIDGGGDGGIDSVYFFINDTLYNEDTDVASLKRNVSLRLVMIQSKATTGFSEIAIDKMIASAKDIFDLNKTDAELALVYNIPLLDKITCFRRTFLSLTSKFPSVSFEYAYATKGTDVDPKVSRKVYTLENVIKEFFTPVDFSFHFFTANELLARARKNPSITSSLRLAENPISTGQEGFICLVTLKDYYTFITDENAHLRSHLFEGNVRDYQGKTEVNVEIHKTLEASANEDFWWLNNGVSIICSNASLSGKVLTILDAEIVNGLQTSRAIYNTYHGKDLSKEARNLLVRVLKPGSEESRDRIIKATNSQTPIPAASLRATDKIHRDIEEYLYSKGYFYDRRKNYYKNIGKPMKRIFGIPFVAQSVLACALEDPASARARPSSLIKTEDAYKRIFNPNYPLDIYINCPVVVQMTKEFLSQSKNENYQKHAMNLCFSIAMLWFMRQFKIPRPSVEQFASVDPSMFSSEAFASIASVVWNEYMKLGGNDQVAKGKELGNSLIEKHRASVIRGLQNKSAS